MIDVETDTGQISLKATQLANETVRQTPAT